MFRRGASLIALALAASASLTGPTAADAAPVVGHPGLVPARPRTDVVRVLDGVALDSEVIGNRIVIGGTFTQVRNTDGMTVAQKYLAAYDKTTGALDLTFNPVVSAAVNDLAVAPDGSAFYAVGEFSTIDGVTRRKVAKLSPDGNVVAAFKANANNRVINVAAGPNRVYLGGKFTTINSVARASLAAVDSTTGNVDPGFAIEMSASVGYLGALTTNSLDLSADFGTLLVVGTGSQIGGQPRYGIALVDVSGATAQLKPWRTRLFEQSVARLGYINPTDGAIAPDGSYAVITTAAGDNPPFGDTALRLPTNVTGDDVQPAWVSRNFDSTYTVALSEHAAYIGGHFQYVEAPGSTEPWPGDTNKNYGTGVGGDGAQQLGNQVVRREHIAALDLNTGKALPWAPGSDSFQGVQSLTTTPQGLLVGHDGSRLGGFSSIGRHGFFDFNRVPPPDVPDSQILDPFVGRNYAGNEPVVVNGTATTAAGRTVKKVTVEVLDKSNRYLQANGTFSTTFFSFAATLASPNAVTTNWTVPLPTVTAGTYTVNSRATDSTLAKEPNKATSSFGVRAIDTVVPTLTVATPAYDKQDFTSNWVDISGTASDNQSVERVEVSIYRDLTQEFLQGNGTVAAPYYSFDAELSTPQTTSTNWRLALNVPNGKWTVTVRVFDPSGLIGRSGTRFIMAPGDADPVVTFTSPTANPATQAGARLAFTGTAADNSSIVKMSAYAYEKTTGLGPRTDGTIGSPQWVDFAPAAPNAASTAWSWTSPVLPVGDYWVLIIAYDNAEKWNRNTATWYSVRVTA